MILLVRSYFLNSISHLKLIKITLMTKRNDHLVPAPQRMSHNVNNWTEATKADKGLIFSLFTILIPVSTHFI